MRALPLPLSLSLSLPMLALPSVALAHAGHGGGSFLAGLSHPLGGLDHGLAMVAVGILAAQTGGRALWAAPASFVLAMVAGGIIGFAGLPFPAVEPMILASIILLGVMVALAVRLPLVAVVPLIAVFGAAHGWAHGTEGPEAGLALYAAGFALATTVLHLAGLAAGRLVAEVPLRVMGAAAALAGALLAVG